MGAPDPRYGAHTMNAKILVVVAVSVAFAADAGAQQYVFPAKGQNAQQQKKSESACYWWAAQQTGCDPAKAPPPAQAPTTASGTTPGAGARGAVRGAVVGEAVGGDARTCAAAGAVAP